MFLLLFLFRWRWIGGGNVALAALFLLSTLAFFPFFAGQADIGLKAACPSSLNVDGFLSFFFPLFFGYPRINSLMVMCASFF